MPHDSKSKASWEGENSPFGSDPIIDFLKRRGFPLTREIYLSLAFPNRNLEADPLTGEEASEVPPEFR